MVSLINFLTGLEWWAIAMAQPVRYCWPATCCHWRIKETGDSFALLYFCPK
jgi:hypothetical protein